MKKTLVISASLKSHRYSNKAVCLLVDNKHEVFAIGQKEGEIKDVSVFTSPFEIDDLDTISLYLSPKRQVEYYDYFLSLKPKRIIMNPGTENDELEKLAIENGIEVVRHCTLVMVNFGTY